MNNRTLLEKQLENSEGQLEKLLLEGKESVRSLFWKIVLIVEDYNASIFM
jgi:hypothetical protein